MTRCRLFVYGTLLSGGPAAGLLGAARRVPAVVLGRLYRMPQGVPALDPSGGQSPVHGQLMDVPDERVLQILDRYEGVDEELYRRDQVVAIAGLRRLRAWCYVMESPSRRGGVHLPEGRWRGQRRR